MDQLKSAASCPRPSASSFTDGLRALAAGVSLLTFAGCGGGGGGGGFALPTSASTGSTSTAPATAPPSAPAPASSTSTITGTAASGAAFAGARLTVTDKTGAAVCDTTVDSQGTYTCELPSTTQAPLVIRALRDGQALYSVTATGTGTVNVTPLTTIIVSRLAPLGDPASFADAVKTDASAADAAKIQAQSAVVLTLLKPLLDALGSSIDPLTGAFAADGTGQDRVLDSIAVSVRPDGTAANIEITLKTMPTAGDSAPVAISFRSSDAALPTLPAISAEALAPAGTSRAVADLMARLTACYALPLSTRVSAPNDTVAVTGGSADVKAAACRTLFVNDDPSTWLSGGSKVGRDAAGNGSFTGLFRPGATGTVWDEGGFEFYRANGDMVLTYRTLDTAGNINFDQLVARDVNGTLKLIGNQYVYSSAVRAAVQQRDFVNSPANTYINVGYDISVANQTDANGAPIFSKVVVTAPDGSVVTLVPTIGNNGLRIRKPDGSVTGTAVIRLNAAYVAASTAGSPATLRSENLYYVSPLLTDDQIAATPDQGVWTLEFFHVDTTKANVIQTHRTLTRAYTLAEASQVTFSALTPAMRSYLQGITAATGRFTYTTPPSAAKPNVVAWGTPQSDAWVVPALAVLPTSFTVYGNAPTISGVTGAAFDDTTNIASTARTAYVVCTPATNADRHCDSSTGVTQYSLGTYWNFAQLIGRSRLGMEHFSAVALYRPS